MRSLILRILTVLLLMQTTASRTLKKEGLCANTLTKLSQSTHGTEALKQIVDFANINDPKKSKNEVESILLAMDDLKAKLPNIPVKLRTGFLCCKAYGDLTIIQKIILHGRTKLFEHEMGQWFFKNWFLMANLGCSDQVDSHGNNPLHLAVLSGSPKMVRLTLDRLNDANATKWALEAKNMDKLTPIDLVNKQPITTVRSSMLKLMSIRNVFKTVDIS